MHVVHRRAEPGGNAVAWISDLTRPFVLVLIETGAALDPEQRLGGTFSHIGFAVGSRADVDATCELARAEGRSVFGPNDYGPPVGYWAYIVDPDGHNLEISLRPGGRARGRRRPLSRYFHFHSGSRFSRNAWRASVASS